MARAFSNSMRRAFASGLRRFASSTQSSSFIARARGAFAATDEAQLSFAKGDVLRVLETAPHGWLLAQKGEEKGFVPSSYVERIEAEERALVRAKEASPFVRCIVCQKALTEPLLCGGCQCISYCSVACAARHASEAHSDKDCADHARYARRDVRVRLPDPEPAWLGAAMDHSCTAPLCATLQELGVHGDGSPYRLLCGCAGPASPPHIEPLEGSPPIREAPSCWETFYLQRGLPLEEPLAALLCYPLTLFHALRAAGLDQGGARRRIGRPIRVHYLGPEKELALWPYFRELAVLMPAADIELEMICAGSSPLELPPPATHHGSDGGRLTIRAHGGHGRWYHDEGRLGLAAPDVAVALNAGLAVTAYNWEPTLRALAQTVWPPSLSAP
jgi:hypothetical protein